MAERERMIWRDGEIVTVVEWPKRPGAKVTIRDSFGFVYDVRKKELAKLRADDERRVFTA